MKLEEIPPRERRVALAICMGQERQEIAAAMEISVKTVDSMRAHTLDRLGLRNSVELCRYAIEHGWIEVPGYHQTAGELVDGFDHHPNEV